ncbi:MAG: PQQ-binding-like beta-propeller repeat protein, partial [Candidatus Moraniibacteriota bacterium]
FFIRKSRKKTGLLKMVEGKMTDEPIILVDDLINHGYTFDRQIAVTDEAKKQVRAVFTVLRFRDIDFYQKFHERGIRVEAVFALDDFHGSLGISNKDTEDARPLPTVFETKWRFQSHDPKLEWVQPKSGVAMDENKIYFGTDRGILWALQKSDGSVAWKQQIGLKPKGGEIFSTPVLWEGRVYFGAHDGNIYCLDAKTGKRLWVSFEADWIEGALLALSDYQLLIVPAMFGLWNKEGGVMALDLATGKKKWERRVKGAITGAPVYAKKYDALLVGSHDGNIYCLERASGRMLWSFKTLGALYSAVAVSSDEETVVVSSMDGFVYALFVKNGMLKWKFEVGLANYSSPFISEGKVYVASLDKSLYCLDLATGKKLWSFPARARIFASPTIIEGKLYIGSNDARLYELDPITGKQTGYFQVTERITNPLYHDPKTSLFYLTTYANEIYCLKKKD